jgi:methylenetetrahydrofolate--tRNA-(uracil-5-)-methyltransferase
MIGALAHYISHPLTTHFQPMNANFGLIEELLVPKKVKKQAYFDRAMKELAYVL